MALSSLDEKRGAISHGMWRLCFNGWRGGKVCFQRAVVLKRACQPVPVQVYHTSITRECLQASANKAQLGPRPQWQSRLHEMVSVGPSECHLGITSVGYGRLGENQGQGRRHPRSEQAKPGITQLFSGTNSSSPFFFLVLAAPLKMTGPPKRAPFVFFPSRFAEQRK